MTSCGSPKPPPQNLVCVPSSGSYSWVDSDLFQRMARKFWLSLVRLNNRSRRFRAKTSGSDDSPVETLKTLSSTRFSRKTLDCQGDEVTSIAEKIKWVGSPFPSKISSFDSDF